MSTVLRSSELSLPFLLDLTSPPDSGERTIIPGRNWGLVVVGRRGIFSGYLDGRTTSFELGFFSHSLVGVAEHCNHRSPSLSPDAMATQYNDLPTVWTYVVPSSKACGTARLSPVGLVFVT
jgi:hypothetical protein